MSAQPSAVVQKLDLVLRMISEAGDPKKFEGVRSAIISAKGRIQRLEVQLAATETLRDRLAMAFVSSLPLPDYSDEETVAELAYRYADAMLVERDITR